MLFYIEFYKQLYSDCSYYANKDTIFYEPYGKILLKVFNIENKINGIVSYLKLQLKFKQNIDDNIIQQIKNMIIKYIPKLDNKKYINKKNKEIYSYITNRIRNIIIELYIMPLFLKEQKPY